MKSTGVTFSIEDRVIFTDELGSKVEGTITAINDDEFYVIWDDGEEDWYGETELNFITAVW